MRGGGGDVPSIISVLLSKDSTEWGNMRVNGRKHRMEEKNLSSQSFMINSRGN